MFAAAAEPPASPALYGSAWLGRHPMTTLRMRGLGRRLSQHRPLYGSAWSTPGANDHPWGARDALELTRTCSPHVVLLNMALARVGCSNRCLTCVASYAQHFVVPFPSSHRSLRLLEGAGLPLKVPGDLPLEEPGCLLCKCPGVCESVGGAGLPPLQVPGRLRVD